MKTYTTPLPPDQMAIFQSLVEKHFGEVATAHGFQLENLSPSLFGFLTSCAIVTIGVYPGHNPAVCIKLRERKPGDKLGENDQRSIGLGVVLKYLVSMAQIKPVDTDYDKLELSEKIAVQAAHLAQYGKPYLTNPNADWKGLRTWLDVKIKKGRTEMKELLEKMGIKS